jgi:hypothetical protein
MSTRAYTLLSRRHRLIVWTRALWIVAGGLALDLVWTSFGVGLGLRLGLLGLFALIAAAAIAWPQQTLRDTARALDARMATRNRLEAIAELRYRRDPLAAALTAEADDYLAKRRLPRPYAWLTAMALSLMLLSLAVRSGWQALQVADPVRTRAEVAAVASTDPAPATDTPAEETAPTPLMPPAVLRWISPEANISASAVETIPLSAEAESSTGLRRVVLQVEVNGDGREPLAIADEVATGVQPLSYSLLLEKLALQPYDVVTYHLQADAIRPKNLPAEPVWPPVASPLQWIQILPPAGDAPLASGGSDQGEDRILVAIQRLKEEEAEAMRGFFALSNGLPSRDDPQWAEAVSAAEARQKALEDRIGATMAQLATTGLPASAGAALGEAQAEARKAVAALAQSNPAAAVAPASRALARLSAAERDVAKVVGDNRNRLAAAAADRALREAQQEPAGLPARESTPAGRLEKLAASQKSIADQLAARTPEPGIFSTQDRLARDVAKLAGERPFAEETTRSMEAAAAAGREAASQLNEQDTAAAMEPATRAAQGLDEAVAAMDSAGRAQATEELLAAQLELARAATALQRATDAELSQAAAAAARQAALVQQGLRASARRQQQTGSAEAAQKLQDFADALGKSGLAKELSALGQSNASSGAQRRQDQQKAAQQMTELAQNAANSAGALGGSRAMQDRAEDDLKRVQANIDRIARSTRPLRWVDPEAEITAKPKETVTLIAEAITKTGLEKLALHLTVNGKKQPPVALSQTIAAGTQSLPVPLALEPLRLSAGDMVSYQLTAEPPGASTKGLIAKSISSPVQLIQISAADPAGKAGGKGGDPEGTQPAERYSPELTAEIVRLQALQRDLVERTFAIERVKESGGSLAEAAKALAGEEQSVLKDVKTVPEKFRPLPARTLTLLKETEKELQGTVGALERADTEEAALHAVRALAALTKVLETTTVQEGANPRENDSSEFELQRSRTNGDKSGSSEGGSQGGQGSAKSRESGSSQSDGQQSRSDGNKNDSDQRRGSRQGSPRPDEDLQRLYLRTMVDLQRLGVISSTQLPPPPHARPTSQERTTYAGVLSKQIEGVIQLAAAAKAERKRTQVLTTAKPADAPPDYRPAVADYFETLARDPATPTRKP